jgi:hypothetical protein
MGGTAPDCRSDLYRKTLEPWRALERRIALGHPPSHNAFKLNIFIKTRPWEQAKTAVVCDQFH